MSILQKLNAKANLRKTSGADYPVSPQYPVVANYEATSSAAQTIINMDFSVDQSNKKAFQLFINGQLYREGASHDFTFTSIASDNTSAQVTLNSPILANLNIIAIKLGTKKESEFNMDNRFVQIYEAQDQGFQGFVRTSNLLTATTGAPSSSQFYSAISNRSAIQDLSSDLSVKFGNDRFAVQTSFALQSEFGANGEVVYGVPNDIQNRIRFVGSWINNTDSSGQYVSTVATNDYIEIVFYGTTLSILMSTAASQDFRATVDNGAEGANIAVSYSTVLNGRSYNPNTLITVASGLSLGMHTVKIRNNAAAGLKISGFDFGVVQANVQVNSGVSYIQGKKLVLGTAALVSPTTGVTGTRGGRMLVYQNSDGTVGRSFQATNASQLNLASADHSNEEVARVYHFREFGANRTDDYSTVSGSSGARAFALEDANAYLVADAAFQSASVTGLTGDSIAPTSTSSFLILSFTGTGLDLVAGGTPADTFNIFVNGSSIGSGVSLSNAGAKTFKIVSGLPYGSHTVKIVRSVTAAGEPGIQKFIVYQPKKPVVPSGATELADYNVMADFVANTTAGSETLATGVLRKVSTRESTFLGTWSAAIAATDAGGWTISSSTTSDYIQYSFFGTGFDFRFGNNATSSTWQFNVDGATNLSGFTTSSYGAGVTSFTSSTGTLVTSASSTASNGVRVSALSLGWHTVKVTKTAGTGILYFNCWDLITPIHSHKSNLNYDQQNALPTGSCSLSDNRKFSPVKDIGSKSSNISQAFGVTSGPSTSAYAFVPVPDLSVTHTNTSGKIRISFCLNILTSNSSTTYNSAIYIDGIQAGVQLDHSDGSSAAGQRKVMSNSFIINLSAGTHKIDVYWNGQGASITAIGIQRFLLVEEVI